MEWIDTSEYPPSPKTEPDLTRRGFVSAAGVGLACIGAGILTGCSSQENKNAGTTGSTNDSVNWAEEYDIIVVGAGGAGFVAAISAAKVDASTKILLIEKQQMVGGSTILSGGNIGAFQTDIIKKRALEEDSEFYKDDTLDMYFEDKMAAGLYQSDPALAKLFVENSNENYEWLKSLGLIWSMTRPYEKAVYVPSDAVHAPLMGASAYLQTYDADGRYSGINRKCRYNFGPAYKGQAAGGAAITCLQDTLATYANAEVQTEIALKRVIRDGETNGDVLGITVTKGSSADEIYLRAKRAVILTSGGFAANGELMHMYDGRIDPATQTTGGRANTGDGMIAAQFVAAQTVNMNSIQVDHGFSTKSPVYPAITVAEGLFQDPGDYIEVSDTGERIWSEIAESSQYLDAKALRLAELGITVWYKIGDATSVTNREAKQEDLDKFAETFGKICNSIQEVADFIGCDVATLEKTISDYNGFVDTGKDTQYGKPTPLLKHRLDTAPYYVYDVTYYVRSTPGGLRIDSNAQVLDLNGKPIPRLFAAGEITGNVHGRFRNNGGDSWTDLVCFGRIAGASAATLS
jgi:succinate dehydrogenase/fumarate reductase flavoprotein subunit